MKVLNPLTLTLLGASLTVITAILTGYIKFLLDKNQRKVETQILDLDSKIETGWNGTNQAQAIYRHAQTLQAIAASVPEQSLAGKIRDEAHTYIKKAIIVGLNAINDDQKTIKELANNLEKIEEDEVKLRRSPLDALVKTWHKLPEQFVTRNTTLVKQRDELRVKKLDFDRYQRTNSFCSTTFQILGILIVALKDIVKMLCVE
jgi:hypothetical protein